MLDVAALEAGYGKSIVLRDVSLEVGAGEVVAIVGRNGAGKSTLLKCLAGLVAQRSGTVTFDGESIGRLGVRERGERGIGFLPQSENVFPHLSVRENLLAAGHFLKRSERRVRADEALAAVGILGSRLDWRASLLSGGEHKALAVAIAVMRRPRLLMLDEPSAGLTPRAVTSLIDSLRHLNSKYGMSLLIVEQNVRAGISIAQRAYATRNGTLIPIESKYPISLEAVKAAM
jgi:branched-chain amino acid transport system ATP-binding protein